MEAYYPSFSALDNLNANDVSGRLGAPAVMMMRMIRMMMMAVIGVCGEEGKCVLCLFVVGLDLGSVGGVRLIVVFPERSGYF